MILFADLEADYINPYDFCTRLNSVCLFVTRGVSDTAKG